MFTRGLPTELRLAVLEHLVDGLVEVAAGPGVTLQSCDPGSGFVTLAGPTGLLASGHSVGEAIATLRAAS